MSELKPCPWPQCKSDSIVVSPLPNEVQSLSFETEGDDEYCAHCEGCGAEGPVSDTRAGAITAWRPPPKARANSAMT